MSAVAVAVVAAAAAAAARRRSRSRSRTGAFETSTKDILPTIVFFFFWGEGCPRSSLETTAATAAAPVSNVLTTNAPVRIACSPYCYPLSLRPSPLVRVFRFMWRVTRTTDGTIALFSMPSRAGAWPHVEPDAPGLDTGYCSMADPRHTRKVSSDSDSGTGSLVVMCMHNEAPCHSLE